MDEPDGRRRHFQAVVEYDGTDFSGFQWQIDTRTVQGVLEDAIHRRTGERVRIDGAGRTDAGVHALGQVISFSVNTRIPPDRVALALNSALPHDIVVRSACEVDAGFHARFSASSRIYHYLILNQSGPSALFRRYTALIREPLDVNAMREAAHSLIGEHDFACFARELDPEASSYREVLRCSVGQHRGIILIRIEANAFLRGMVRAIAGTLVEVGEGKRSPDSLRALMATRDRRLAGPTAPAQGLCLVKVRYGIRKQYARQ